MLYKENTPYTYLIGWSKQNKYYYGVQFGKNASPNNLWVTYFTSSNYVRKFRKEYGESDIIQIRKTFDDPGKARLWETRIIQKMNLVENDMWLNKTNNTSKFYFEGKRPAFTKEHREKISESSKKRKLSIEHKKKLNEGRRNSKNTDAHKEAVSKAVKGKKHSEESRKNMSNGRMNIPEDKRKSLSAIAGKASAERYKNDTARQIKHSERMTLWWTERKKKLCELEGI